MTDPDPDLVPDPDVQWPDRTPAKTTIAWRHIAVTT